LTVLSVSQKAINCSTPDSSPEKGGKIESPIEEPVYNVYEDLETAFLANIGNWKKVRRQDNKDIYKCNECECKLEVEKKGNNFRVRSKNYPLGESH
jgi:hypothetical protein